jgi:Xaa-Pro aminopeptidase
MIMDYQRRLTGLQLEMQKRDIDLVLYGACPNFQYLTGIKADWRLAPDHRPAGDLVLIPRQSDPVLILSGNYNAEGCPIKSIHPYEEAKGYTKILNSIIKDFSLKVRKLALGSYLPIPAVMAAIQSTQNPELLDASRLMDHLRMLKEPEELASLRAVAKLTDEVMLKVIRSIKDGVSQRDLMLEIEMQARRMGASGMSFKPWACFVKSGSSATEQLSDYPINKGLTADTAITFDVGFVMNGYCSDWGRSVYWGTPPQDAIKAHNALRRAMVETVAELKDGNMRSCDVYPAMEKKLDSLGYGDYLRARLASNKIMGHQIGVEVHENPWLRPDFSDILREGMVMCIEPKLWHAGEYYFRLEEMVYFSKNGAEFLTNFDREIFRL